MLVLVICGSLILSVTGHGGHQHSLYFPEISENKAKSFLYNRHIRSLEINASPKPEYCTYLHPGYESWCEQHIPYCQGQQEFTREHRCATLSTPCSPGQHCVLTTPCPAHFRHNCVDINECDSNPCQNGGTCHNGNNQYTCTCLPGWTGTNCEIDIDECASTPCMYGNDCIQDRINSYICVCSERFEGVHCERDCRPGPADVMFLIDTSFSQKEAINQSVDFMTEFVKQIPIGPNDFQVSLVSFSLHPKTIFNFTTFQSNSSLLNALSLIESESGPTKTSDALQYASQKILNPANGARLLSNISHYVILVTNGLSTDRNQAIHTAQILRNTNPHFKIYAVGIGEDIAHEELVQLPTDASLSFSPDNNDLLLAMLKDAADYGCTDCNSTSLTDVIILFDTSEDSSPLKGSSLHSLKFVDKLVDSFDMAHTDIKVAMLTFSSDSQIKFNFSHISDQDMKAKIFTTTVDNRQGNTSIRVGLLKMEEFFTSPSSGGRPEARKICYLFTNGKWPTSENSELKHKIEELNAAGISVNVMVTVDDTDSYSDTDMSLTNAKEIAFDPYRVYIVEENNDYVIIQAAARETRYVKCPSDIFKSKH